MSSVLDRDALESSPLADLHLIANELGVDGFRRLRKTDLVEAIVAKQSGDEPEPEAEAEAEPEVEAEAPRARRSRGRARSADPEVETEEEAEDEEGATDEDAPARSRRGRRGGRGRGRRDDERDSGRDRDRDGGRDRDRDRDADRGGDVEAEDRLAEGAVELLGNGSAFIRLSPPETTDDDVYVSAAQVKRCELVSGDRISGPVRSPRRSERFPSLVRVDTINGRPADEVAEGTRFDDLPAAWPAERLALGSDDVTLKAVEWLTPFGKGSRVLIAGGPRAGKSELLRAIAGALQGREGLELLVVLAGVRPEEAADWADLGPVATATFAASPDAQAQAVEQAIEQGRRVAARGGDAV
ncbi:MAG TPA: Rho termination factor N-terminal domain-containing protein, partial [Solirubrobacteraceae bacterium]|nr:Rho termination factor N-terminal domain-containing protein [Solirubrobacteraceae bacterium]